MSRYRRTAVPERVEQAAGASVPRLTVAIRLALVALVVGVIAAAYQPYDPGALGCSKRVPPDETAHVLYVRYLLEQRSLPVLTSGSGNYEAHQPPLYYVTAVPWMALGRALGWSPPVALSGAPPPDVWLGRLWSVIIAAGVTVACYLLACAVFPRALTVRIAAPLFAALLPGHIINLAAITNDGLAELLSTVVLWQCVVLIREAPTRQRVTIIGLLIGVALLTKTSCLFLLPVAAVAVLLSASPWAPEPSSWRRCIAGWGLVVGPALLLWAPWIAHNLSAYPGDPLVTRTFVEVFGKDRWTPEHFSPLGARSFAYWRLVAVWTYLSFWGVFGQAMVFMPGWYYLLGTLLVAALLFGASKVCYLWRETDRRTRIVWSLLAMAVILVCFQFVSFNCTFFQAQARYLFPVIGPLACAFAAALELFARRMGGTIAKVGAYGCAGLVLGVLLVAALVEIANRGPSRFPNWL